MLNLIDTTITVIGTSDFGLAIAQCFTKLGAKVTLSGRDIQKVGQRAADMGINSPVQPMLNAVVNADIVFLAVANDKIESTCKTLSINFKKGAVVAHFAPELDSTILKSAHRKDSVAICSLYAMNIFPDLETTLKLLSNRFHRTYLYCEGDPQALSLSNSLFKEIGFLPVEISRTTKPKLHAATAMAKDYLTILMESSAMIAKSAGVDSETFWRSLQPLVKGTLQSISDRGSHDTLNGPIMSGDATTVAHHLKVLDDVGTNIPELYANLGKHVLSRAVKQSAFDRDSTLKIHKLLNDACRHEH